MADCVWWILHDHLLLKFDLHVILLFLTLKKEFVGFTVADWDFEHPLNLKVGTPTLGGSSPGSLLLATFFKCRLSWLEKRSFCRFRSSASALTTTPYPFAESHDKKKAAPNSSGAFVAEAEKASAAPPNLSSSVFLHLHHLKVSWKELLRSTGCKKSSVPWQTDNAWKGDLTSPKSQLKGKFFLFDWQTLL